MRFRNPWWLILPIIAAAVVCSWRSGWLARVGVPVVDEEPRIDYPSTIDLGKRELGETGLAAFQISNPGASQLVISRIRTSCSCSGIEREQGGEYYRLDSLTLEPGEVVDLRLRLKVRGVPVGLPMTDAVDFSTNVPGLEECRIKVRVPVVTGGVYTTPSTVVFGNLLVGEPGRDVVDVMDTAAAPRSIERIKSNDPDHVSVRLLVDEIANVPTPIEPSLRRIGRIEVVVNTGSPCQFKASVLITLTGESRKQDEFVVMGRVLPNITVSPSHLAFPRNSSTGPLYQADCVCTSQNGKPLSVTVAAAPPGITVEINSGSAGSGKVVVRVKCDKDLDLARFRGTSVPIQLRAQAGDAEETIELVLSFLK